MPFSVLIFLMFDWNTGMYQSVTVVFSKIDLILDFFNRPLINIFSFIFIQGDYIVSFTVAVFSY